LRLTTIELSASTRLAGVLLPFVDVIGRPLVE
jgi:hypothetical protein